MPSQLQDCHQRIKPKKNIWARKLVFLIGENKSGVGCPLKDHLAVAGKGLQLGGVRAGWTSPH